MGYSMIHVHLYGKLRRFTDDSSPTSASIAEVTFEHGDTVRHIVDRLGIPHDELGSNMFLNGRYADLGTAVADGDRLGLFPDDMQLLYKWYFSPASPAAPNVRSAGLESQAADSSPASPARTSSQSRESASNDERKT